MQLGKRKWITQMRFRNFHLVSACIATILVSMTNPPVFAQEETQYQAAAQRYEKSLEAWRGVYLEIIQVYSEFQVCEESEAEALKEKFLELTVQGDELADETMLAAAALLENSVTADPDLLRFLQSGPLKFYEACRYGDSVQAGRAILKHTEDNFDLLYDTVRSAFFDNQFEYAGELMEQWIAAEGKLPSQLQGIYASQKELIKDWEKEKTLRETEEEKDHLPRIAFEMEGGKVVVELFEDQFPVVVNNLMWLASQEANPFFIDQAFFFVLKHQLAMTGSRTDDGKEIIFVSNATAEQKKRARQIFRGSFGLNVRQVSATQTVLSTGCQFFPIPRPDMADSTLVVGRVVEGMELIDNLEETHEIGETGDATPLEEAIPSRFIRVSVDRKPEGKEYEFIQPGTPRDAKQGPAPQAEPAKESGN